MIGITGSGGFLGQAVVAALRAQHKMVLGCVHTDDPHLAYSLLAGRCAVILHLAGETRDPWRMYDRNVHHTQILVDICRVAQVTRLVLVSSVAVTELEQSRTTTAYAWSKWAAEQAVRNSGLDVRILRLPTIYGTTGMKRWPIMALKTLAYGRNPWALQSLEDAVAAIVAATR